MALRDPSWYRASLRLLSSAELALRAVRLLRVEWMSGEEPMLDEVAFEMRDRGLADEYEAARRQVQAERREWQQQPFKRTNMKTEPTPKAERVIALIGGDSGSGKSLFIAHLENALIFDTDIGGGLSAYDARIERNGSERIEAGSYLDVLNHIKKHRADGSLAKITTLAIDHLTTLHQESVNRHNPNGAEDFGKSYDKARREWMKVREAARLGDFNLICTAHMKAKYEKQGTQSVITGITTDAAKNLEADMMVVLYLQRTDAYPSVARVNKWRRDPEDVRGVVPSTFPFTMKKFIDIHGWPLDGKREEIVLASPEQVKELTSLLAVVRLPDDTIEKWKAKAKADNWDDFTSEAIGKCIAHVKEMIAKAGKSAEPATREAGDPDPAEQIGPAEVKELETLRNKAGISWADCIGWINRELKAELPADALVDTITWGQYLPLCDALKTRVSTPKKAG